MNRFLSLAAIAAAIACAPAAEFGASDDALELRDFRGIEVRQLLSYLNSESTTYDALVELPFCSKTQAAAIMAHRNGFNGVYGDLDDDYFNSIEEFDGVKGIGPVTINLFVSHVSSRGIRDFVTVDGVTMTRPEAIGLVRIGNKATSEQLDIEAGLSPSQANAIIAARAKYGSFNSADQIGDVTGIGPVAIYKLLAYLWQFEPVKA